MENEGLAQDSLQKMVKILVMTVTGWGSVARYTTNDLFKYIGFMTLRHIFRHAEGSDNHD